MIEIVSPFRAWWSWTVGGTYVNVARRGDADALAATTLSGINAVGQNFIGATDYYCLQLHYEFDLSSFIMPDTSDTSSAYVVDDLDFTWNMADDTATQTWTCRIRENNWPDGNPSEVVHMGSGGMTSHTQLWHWTMADVADDPDLGESWTEDSAVAVLNALFLAHTDPDEPMLLKVTLHSARQQSELAPTDNEILNAAGQDAFLTISANCPIRTPEADLTIPAITNDVVVKPKETVTALFPAPTVAAGNMTGPVTATATVPRITAAATAVRLYNQDELFGFIDDDGRRLGRVV